MEPNTDVDISISTSVVSMIVSASSSLSCRGIEVLSIIMSFSLKGCPFSSMISVKLSLTSSLSS